MSTACSNDSTSKLPSERRNLSRLIEARLQAESSTCMYSEHGFDALMRPEFGQVCHSLIVVSYWTPGSAQRQAASAICSSTSRAGWVSTTEPLTRAVSSQSSPRSARSMNSSDTRTELLAFWYWIEANASESRRMSKPASLKAAAFSSSLALHQMNSRTSGWSTSSTTIFAARRVPPPDLIEPAHASAPRMNETGPEAVPPLLRGSFEPRIFERLIPDPEPPRKIIPSFVFHSRIDSMSSSTERMKQADIWFFWLSSGCQPQLNQTGELNAAI